MSIVLKANKNRRFEQKTGICHNFDYCDFSAMLLINFQIKKIIIDFFSFEPTQTDIINFPAPIPMDIEGLFGKQELFKRSFQHAQKRNN